MIFVDTGPFLARHIEADQFHGNSIEEWSHLEKSPDRICTSHDVIDEFVTLLGRRAGPKFAADRAVGIFDSSRITLLRTDEEDDRRALTLYEKFGDNGISFTDAVSFALMKRHRIHRAFTFDRHFRIAGFQVVP